MSEWGQTPEEIIGVRHHLRVDTRIICAMVTMSAIAGLLRIYVRGRLIKKFGWDDYAMMVAQAFYIPCVGLILVLNGWFIIFYDGGAIANTNTFTLMARSAYTLYILTVIAIKVSLSIFMLQIFGRHDLRARLFIYTLTIIPGLVGIISIVIANASCAMTFEPVCPWRRHYHRISLAFSFTNSIADFSFACLAFLILWRMTMTFTAKVSASVLFFLGTVGSLASLLRVIAYFQPASEVQQHIRYTRWSMVEAGTIITAVCLFTLRPLFQGCGCGCFGRTKAGSGSPSKGSDSSRQKLSAPPKGNVAELQTHGLVEKEKDVLSLIPEARVVERFEVKRGPSWAYV